MTPATFDIMVDRLRAAGFADSDIEWSEALGPPADADDFASEAIFVICNSGMQNKVARAIYERVMPLVKDGRSAGEGFGHKGKVGAIDTIWRERDRFYRAFMSQPTDEGRLAELRAIPWIGGITCFHLAKNFGVDVAKPDVHLARLAALTDETAQGLCERLAKHCGLRVATVDVLIWRACAEGIINSHTGEFRSPA